MAQQMLGLADDFEAEYHGDEDLNSINLPEPADEEQEDRLAVYYSVAELGGEAQPRVDVPHEGAGGRIESPAVRAFPHAPWGVRVGLGVLAAPNPPCGGAILQVPK
jgi:hypothetical protein